MRYGACVMLALSAGCGGLPAKQTPAPAPTASSASSTSSASALTTTQPDAGNDPRVADCERKMRDDFDRQRVSFDAITSVQNLRIRLATFGRVCADSFPEWADAATRASKVGVAGRRAIFAELVSAECPLLLARSGRDVVVGCPAFVGVMWNGAARAFLERVDAGTFAFSTLLRKHGFGVFAEELALQASFHPELDP